MGDMIGGGATLDTPAAWAAWPKKLALLVYHGGDDPVCDVKASERFTGNCGAEDVTFEVIKVRDYAMSRALDQSAVERGGPVDEPLLIPQGMFHEVHNELDPTPAEVALLVGEWVIKRSTGTTPKGVADAPAAAKL
jgi:acylglycerol lipase